MTGPARRGVTRGYVAGLIFAAVIVAAALTVAVWGLLSLGLGIDPVSTRDRPRWVAPVVVAAALGLLAWLLWLQALSLLRGRRTPHWGATLAAAAVAYLLWCLVGFAVGLGGAETWASPFAWSLVPIWATASLLFWAVLARRVYSDRGVPKWPWEREDDLGPDWANYGIDPWSEGDGGTLGGGGGARGDDDDPKGGDR
ncbi:hypothetical protein JD276_10950 [Leucobacter sp. CSA1]|uniref:Uncharacterized protein n=1 Tax=Leucobacter chromiisoli TaxID=2796471 RepID=A0A934UW47_9MICO|nr:hypothetical protein [Leucobacter chromiisoli]MBK0419552.1 hypothetical protein [Leucobacter chromiisoli]